VDGGTADERQSEADEHERSGIAVSEQCGDQVGQTNRDEQSGELGYLVLPGGGDGVPSNAIPAELKRPHHIAVRASAPRLTEK
jgi:hypothetical protein